MDKIQLFNKLKAEGKIPDGLTVETVTEKYLLDLELSNVNPPSPPTQLKMEEFQEHVTKMFDDKVKALGLDKIDLKYAKLPGIEIPEAEAALMSPDKLKKKKMLNFVNSIFNRGTYYIEPGNTLALNTEGTTTTGGFTVPVEFIAMVSMLLNEYGVFRANANYMTMNSMTATMPKLNAQPSGAFVNEAAAYGESNATFTQVTYTRHDYGFISGLSKQLLQDTGVDLVRLLAELGANDIAYAQDYHGFRGTGSPITGVFAAITDAAYIVTTSGTNPNTLTVNNLLSLLTKPKTAGLKMPKWYFKKEILSLILAMKDLQDRPIFTLTDMQQILATKILLGYPYELSDALNDATNTAATPIILFGDLKRCATLAEREQFGMAMSDTATVGSNSAFEKKLMFFRLEASFDVEVEQPTAMAKIVTHA